MGSYLLRRLASLVLVLLLVSFLSFSLIHLVPGDPAAAVLGDQVTDVALYQQVRADLGLDKPYIVQYGIWLGHLLEGQLGVSISGQPVLDQIIEALGPTLMLTIMTVIVAVVVGVSLGLVAGTNIGSRLDSFISALSIFAFSVPGFLVGMLLLYSFTVRWPILPSGGYVPFTEHPILSIRSLLLPALSLGTAFSSVVLRQMRGSVAKTMRQDFITVARAKGLSTRVIVLRHALKNSLIPVLTIIGLQTGHLFGGVAVVETIFSIPGMGHLAVDSIFSRNYPVLQAVILVTAVLVMLVNLIVDLLYAAVDPRVRYQ